MDNDIMFTEEAYICTAGEDINVYILYIYVRPFLYTVEQCTKIRTMFDSTRESCKDLQNIVCFEN